MQKIKVTRTVTVSYDVSLESWNVRTLEELIDAEKEANPYEIFESILESDTEREFTFQYSVIDSDTDEE